MLNDWGGFLLYENDYLTTSLVSDGFHAYSGDRSLGLDHQEVGQRFPMRGILGRWLNHQWGWRWFFCSCVSPFCWKSSTDLLLYILALVTNEKTRQFLQQMFFARLIGPWMKAYASQFLENMVHALFFLYFHRTHSTVTHLMSAKNSVFLQRGLSVSARCVVLWKVHKICGEMRWERPGLCIIFL